MFKSLTITRPDDWHVHMRSDSLLRYVSPYTAAQFGRALIMPNLNPPITTVCDAIAYRNTILKVLPKHTTFDPKMSIYLNDMTSKQDVLDAGKSSHILGFKLYPAGTTINSNCGVKNISNLMEIFELMAKKGVPLQIHGEISDTEIDIFDRESVFIEKILIPLHQAIPDLKIVLEHVTTCDGVDFVKQTSQNIAATITPQHLMYNRNELFKKGIRPHYYCLPILKREKHRQALLKAATGGNSSFFLGTDSAPHIQASKESHCGCAGIFSACHGIEFYAEIFEKANALSMLEGFASYHGADFYNLSRNQDTLTLLRTPHRIVDSISVGTWSFFRQKIIPLMAGKIINWRVK